MGADDFFCGVKEAVMADVEPKCAVVTGGVGERCVPCRCDFKSCRDVEAINDSGAVNVGGGGCLVAVAVSDGREEAKLGKPLVKFSIEQILVGINANYEAVAVLVPPVELFEEVPAEGCARVREVVPGGDQKSFVLAVY